MFTDFNNTFDSTNALAALFLWLLFGFLSHMINCDLQRLLVSSALVRHAIGVLAFFFLFTLLDGKSRETPTLVLIVKTLLVYILFIFTTKSKWYFALPVLSLLLLDQIMKHSFEYNALNTDSEEKKQELQSFHQRVNYIINVTVIIVILVGLFHYMYLQKIEYREKFSLYKFFVETNKNCKDYNPDYKNMLK